MKKPVRIALVLGMGLALAPISVHAQAPEAQPAAVPAIPVDQQATKEQMTKLFEAMKIKEQMASVMKMMPGIMQQQVAQQMQQMKKDHPEMATMTDEQQKQQAKVMSKFMERVMTVYGSDDMLNEMAAVYQRHLTSADVDGIIAFYNSPAGQHMVTMAPAIMQEFMPTMMKHMQERMKPVIDDMTKEMAEIAKSQADAKPAATPVAK